MTTTITLEDYPRIIEAIKLKHTIKLDLNGLSEEDLEEIPYEKWIPLGSIQYAEDTGHVLPGNLTSYQWGKLLRDAGKDEETELQKLLQPVVMGDGSAGLEITYLPLCLHLFPADEEAIIVAKEIFNQTNLSSVMTLEQFIQDVVEEEDWIYQCFAQDECYDLLFSPEPLGQPSKLFDQLGSSLCDPIPLTFGGEQYDIHVWDHSD